MAHNTFPLRLRHAVVFLLYLYPTAALAQNVREGFVWGGGLGVSATAHWAIDGRSENKVGLAAQGLIGYLVSHRNLVCLEIDEAIVESPTWGEITTHSFLGPSWYHYYGRPGRSAISLLGVGWYTLDAGSSHSGGYDPLVPPRPYGEKGLGWLVGIGYEFHRNWQGIVSVMFGRPNADPHLVGEYNVSNEDYTAYSFTFMIARVSN